MIQNKTILIAHNWSDVSVSQQSKKLALDFSKNNKIVFFNAKKNGFNNVSINSNLIIHEWPGVRPTGIRDMFFAIRKIRYYKPDIVIVNFGATGILLFVSWLFRVKTRVCYHHTLVEQYIADNGKLGTVQQFKLLRKRLLFKLATHIIAPSTQARKDLIKYYHALEQQIHILPNALPTSLETNKQNGNNIGFIGRLHRSKGVDILINAFKYISEIVPSSKLIIAGSGSEEQLLRKIAEEAKIADRIEWKGRVDYEQVNGILLDINFLVVPSRIDNLPTVVLEAFSTGTPVIGTDTGGIPDMVFPNENGLLFINEDDKDLAEKMLLLLNNKEQRLTLGSKAKQYFEEKYSLENFSQKFEAIIKAE